MISNFSMPVKSLSPTDSIGTEVMVNRKVSTVSPSAMDTGIPVSIRPSSRPKMMSGVHGRSSPLAVRAPRAWRARRAAMVLLVPPWMCSRSSARVTDSPSRTGSGRPAGLGALDLLLQALHLGVLVARQLAGPEEGPGDLQEAEAHQVGAERDGQVDDPDRDLQVRRGGVGVGHVPDEVGPEGPHQAGEQGPGEEPEEDELAPPALGQVVDQDVHADVDAGAHPVGRAELGHPHEHVDAQLLGPAQVDGEEPVVDAHPSPSRRTGPGCSGAAPPRRSAGWRPR